MLTLLKPFAAGFVALALVGGAACSSTSGGSPAATTVNGSAAVSQPAQSAVPVRKANNELSTADIAKLAIPSVVRIQTSSGVGTGFFVSDDGYIMTNNHVVQTGTGRGSSNAIKVTLEDGSVKDATAVGTDARSDLALIKIDGKGYKGLTFASLEDTPVGADVVAIGFALDLPSGAGVQGDGSGAPTVTRGIVSAKNRSISETSAVLGAIQTDAAINHGNSGGPLLNMMGEVVGVNTAIAPDSSTGGVASGIGFAVGADTVKAVFEKLRDTGKVNRGLLGIRNFEALRPAKAQDLGLPADQGGIFLPENKSTNTGQAVQTVAPAGAADKAGIKPGDVITKIGGASVRDESELAVALIKHPPGEKVAVEFFRAGKKQTVDVTLGTP
jgi:S1-C subfamily serine protease